MADQNNETPQAPKVEDPRTLVQLKEELVAREFVGADTLTTKAQALAILSALEKKDADAVKNAALNDPSKLDKVKDDERNDLKKYESKAAKMKAHLAKQPKVMFLIPLTIGEKRGAVETWQANGYRLNILKGVLVEIPKQVAESLAESYQLTQEAGENFSIDRPKTDGDAPYKTVREALE